MLPSLSTLVREHTLFSDALRTSTAQRHTDADDRCSSPPHRRCRSAPADAADETLSSPYTAAHGGDCMEHLPQELLAGIAGRYLESCPWHLCKLGEASPRLGKVFSDEVLWHGLLHERFRAASQSPYRRSHQATQAPNSRLSYARLHSLEARFCNGQFKAHGKLSNPHQGEAVLDVHISPGDQAKQAYAALKSGSIMVYDFQEGALCPEPRGDEPQELDGAAKRDFSPAPKRRHAQPKCELTPQLHGGSALCCLPVNFPGETNVFCTHGMVEAPLLTAGFSLGMLAAWKFPEGNQCTPEAWRSAHAGRVTSLAVCGTSILSASSDCRIKEWYLGNDRFGELHRSYSGLSAPITSVASAVCDNAVFLSGGHDKVMRLWDTRVAGGGAIAAQWQQQDWVTCVMFHPKDQNLVCSSDKSVHVWDLRKPGTSALASTHKHRKLISRFRMDPLRLASCSLDGSVMVSSLEAPQVRQASPHASPQNSPQLTSSPPPFNIVPSFFSTSTDVSTLKASKDYVLCIDFDATRLVAGSVDGHVDVFDFSQAEHFRANTPLAGRSPDNTCSSQPTNFQMSGFHELEI